MKPENQQALKQVKLQTLTILFGGRTDCPEFQRFGDTVDLEKALGRKELGLFQGEKRENATGNRNRKRRIPAGRDAIAMPDLCGGTTTVVVRHA